MDRLVSVAWNLLANLIVSRSLSNAEVNAINGDVASRLRTEFRVEIRN